MLSDLFNIIRKVLGLGEAEGTSPSGLRPRVEVLTIGDGISIEMQQSPGYEAQFFLKHKSIGDVELSSPEEAADEINYLYDNILKKKKKAALATIRSFWEKAETATIRDFMPASPPEPAKSVSNVSQALVSVLTPAFELAKEYNKVYLVKQRVDLGPQVFRTHRTATHKPRTLNWQLQYFISYGFIKQLGVFLKVELRGKGSKPHQIYLKTQYQGLTPTEMAEQLTLYNVRLRELSDFIDFAASKRGRHLKGIKPGKDPLTKHMKVRDKEARRTKQRSKVPGKDIPGDEPVDVRQYRAPGEPEPTHQFHTTKFGSQRFGSELSSPSAATARKPDDAPAQEIHKLTQSQAAYSMKYVERQQGKGKQHLPSHALVCNRCKSFRVNLKGKQVVVLGQKTVTGLCQLVRDDINPYGTCKLWQRIGG